MKRMHRGSIRKRLTGLILSIVTFAILVGYSIFAIWYYYDQKQQSLEEAQSVSYVIAQDMAKLILLNDVSAASDVSAKLDSFPFLNWLVLYKKDRTPIYQYSKSHQNFHVPPLKIDMPPEVHAKSVTYTTKAIYRDSFLGYIRMDIRIKTIGEIIYSNIWWFILIYLLMIFASYLLASYYAKKFTKPIIESVHFLEAIDLSRISCQQRLSLDESNEFSILEERINTMLEGLENAFSKQRIAAVAFETPSGMIITDEKMQVIEVNKAYTQITGYLLEDIIGKKPPVLRCEVEDRERYKMIERMLSKQHYWTGEIKNCKKDGSFFTEYLSIQEVYDSQEERVTHYVFSFIDLSVQKEVESKVAYLMEYDPLTGLANKSLLVKKLGELHHYKESTLWHALIGFDIKNFKMVNDAYGYEIGDRALQEIAHRLKSSFSDSTLIAKIGIDEFILSYIGLDEDKDSALVQAQMIAEYLHSVISEPFEIEGHQIYLSIRVGVNLYKSGMEQMADDVLKNTDAALQIAKSKDEKIAFFDKELEQQVRAHVDLYTDLQEAIRSQRFELYYQPQYDQKESLCGAEALIRWNHPKKGLISPMEFIPIAEKSGLIMDIGKWVLHEACRQLALWKDDPKFSHLTLSVNVSAKQFGADDFVLQVEEALRQNGAPYEKLKLELVESVLLNHRDETIDKMKILRRMGIKISMDDFGTGYSSLEYLKVLPLDQIKIDRSFILHMHNGQKDLALVKTMISLGEAFGFEVVAEGVESREDVTLLKRLGCHIYQGYFFSKPLPIEKFLKL